VQCNVGLQQQLQLHGRVGKDSYNRDSTDNATLDLFTVPVHAMRAAGSPRLLLPHLECQAGWLWPALAMLMLPRRNSCLWH
jgi:hypothetical protein